MNFDVNNDGMKKNFVALFAMIAVGELNASLNPRINAA